MSTRKLGVALGAAVLLLGMPTSYALAGNGGGKGEGKPDKAPHQCEDSLDNDQDGLSDLDDPDCESPRDNSEAAETPEEPGGTPGAPEIPAELQAVIDQVTDALGGGGEEPPGEEEPPNEEEPPSEQPDPAAELQALVDELTGGGQPAPPALPAPDPAALEALLAEAQAALEGAGAEAQAAVEAAVAELTGQIPPPPA